MRRSTKMVVLGRKRLNYYFPLEPISDFIAARSYNYGNVTDVLTTPSGTYPGGSLYGGVLLPDGRVFCVPFNSTTARIYGLPLSNNLPIGRTHSAFDNKL